MIEGFKVDVAIVGAGGAGLRAAIAAAEADSTLTVTLISKVYPMRSHTVAAESGAAAVTQAHDSLEAQFHYLVAGGDWLCEPDVVEYFVGAAHDEMVQMDHWGCPWSRKPDGHAVVRRHALRCRPCHRRRSPRAIGRRSGALSQSGPASTRACRGFRSSPLCGRHSHHVPR